MSTENENEKVTVELTRAEYIALCRARDAASIAAHDAAEAEKAKLEAEQLAEQRDAEGRAALVGMIFGGTTVRVQGLLPQIPLTDYEPKK